jgi:predicted nucleic acid-binding protein
VASIVKATNQFIDTNVLLYLLSADTIKANRAEKILVVGGTVSVQVLNEFASVASRKLKMSFAEIREVLSTIRALCKVVPLNEETHDRGLQIAEKHKFSIYDVMIVAAALLSGCSILLSEDMQHGQKIEGTLKIQNPFR